MDPLTIGLILGITGFVGGLITNGINRRNVSNTNQTNQQIAHDTNQASALLAQQQHQWNVQDYERQFRDSSPEVQMQRFREAGLNPNLIYGQISDAPSINSTSLPSLTAIPSQPFQAFNPVGNTASDILSISQAHKNDVESEVMMQKLPEELANMQKLNEQMQANINELNKKLDVYSAQISNLNLDGQLKVAQAAKNYFDMNLASATFERDSNKVLAEINYLRSLSDESESRTALNKRNLYELRETWSYRLLGLDLDNMKVASEVGLNRAKIVESNFVSQQLGLDIQAGRLHAAVNQSLYDTSFGRKGSKLERKVNRALLTITDYFGKSALSIGNGLQSAGALKMLMK